MLGQPVSMLIPEVVGFRLTGKLQGRRHRHRPRAHRHRDAAHARAWSASSSSSSARASTICRSRTAPPSPTWRRNMARPAASSRSTRRRSLISRRPAARSSASRWSRPMPRRRACAATTTRPTRCSPTRSSSISATVEPSLAGPKRPQDRVPLTQRRSRLRRGARQGIWQGATRTGKRVPVKGTNFDLGHGDVVIAAITSCTNTSNPSVMVAAGLLARKAR